MNAFNDLDDQELVNWAKTDYGAFDVLYRRYVTPVYRYCYARTNNVADAEDITTQTFLACLESIQRYRGQGNFAAWLFRIAHNKCADFYRRTYSNGHHSTNDQDDLMENVPDTDDQTNPEAQSYLREMLDCVARGLPV